MTEPKPEPQPVKLLLGITRWVTADPEPGTGPLDVQRARMAQYSTDRIEIELPPGHYLARIWCLADGEPILDVPAYLERWLTASVDDDEHQDDDNEPMPATREPTLAEVIHLAGQSAAAALRTMLGRGLQGP